MLDPRTIMMAIPAYSGQVMAELTGTLGTCQGMYAAISLPTECSHVSLVRNLIAGQFLQSNFEWLVCVDSDIVFSRSDLEILLQPCDVQANYFLSDDDPGYRRQCVGPMPTRLGVAQVPSRSDLDSKTVAAADVLVCAEYPFKNDDLHPVKFGMGFVRIHRSVFRTLEALKHDGGSTVEVQRHNLEALRAAWADNKQVGEDRAAALTAATENLLLGAEDKAGQERLWRISHRGRMYHDFFPSGPIQSQFVPTVEWKGEDHGFFTLCMLAGIVPRIETRTRLLHIGRKAYPYLGPDQGGGQ